MKWSEKGIGCRRLLHMIVRGEQERIIQVYLHVLEENRSWMSSNPSQIMREFEMILEDNLEILQQQVIESESSNEIFPNSFYRLRGETIAIAYKITKRLEIYQTVIVSDEMEEMNMRVIPIASFVMNPVYIFPYGTYPLVPGPSQSSTTTSITDFYQVLK